jgi:transposase
MEKLQEIRYVKRTQKGYSMTLKLQIVQEIEQGKSTISQTRKQHGIQSYGTILGWLKKFGNFDWENQTPSNIPKLLERRIMELEAQVKLLEKQKAFLEQQANVTDKKLLFLI